MSASASKKKRKELEQQGLSPKALAEQKVKEQKSKTLKTVLIVALVVVVCLAAVLGVVALTNAPSYDTKAAVATVGEEKITVPVYDYFYNLNASNFYSNYSFLVQAGTPLSQQSSFFGDGGTLEDYMISTTNNSLKEVYNVYAKAKAEGYQLTDEDKTSLEQAMDSVKTEASTYGFSSPEKYLKARFGEGCDLNSYEEYLKVFLTYSSYANKLNQDFAPTAQELADTYTADPNAFDTVTFSYKTVTAQSTTEETDEKDENGNPVTKTVYTDEAKAAAKEEAEGYAAEMPADAASVSYSLENATGSFGEEVANWVFDAARTEGETKVFARNEEETSYYVVRYDSRDTNDYSLVDANVITITKDTAEVEEGQQTAEEKKEALEAAVEDGMSDEDFSAAVTALGYSGTTNSIPRTYSDVAIRDFLYEEGRKAGDLSLIETETSYVLVRYASTQEDSYRDLLVKNSLWSDFYKAIAEANEIQIVEDMMQYANTDLTFNANTSEE